MEGMVAFWIIFAFVWSIAWGAYCASTVSKKGYDASTAALYFFFGLMLTFIAALLAYAKEDLNVHSKDSINNSQLPTVNVPVELKKYKELYDQGVITEQEFQMKKEQLLNMM